MNGGLSEFKSGMLKVQIASLNSPSDVTKSSFEKLNTFFVRGEKDLDLSEASCPKAIGISTKNKNKT